MIDIDNMSNKALVKDQYANTDNLGLRKSLHEKYSVNKIGFQRWMFEQYPFRAKMKVLELGSRRGELWNYYFESDILRSYEMDITLSDFSDAMVDHLQQYIYSMTSLQGLDRKKYDVLLNYSKSKKGNGYLHIPKEYGMFVAGKE